MSDREPSEKLPAIIRPLRREVAIPPAPATTIAGVDTDSIEMKVPLSHYFWVLRRHRWRILLSVAGCVLATLAVTLRLTPIYEATATIDIDRQSPTRVIGQDATAGALNDSDQFLSTQVRIIQSDSVLRPVVEHYPLLAAEEPALARMNERAALSAGSAEAPVALNNLTVIRPPNTYLLMINYRSKDPQLAADVANAVARSYIEHTFDLRFDDSVSLTAFMDRQVEELKAKMERSTAALAQFEKELNVINPEEKTSILTARLLQLNTEYTNAQADRVRKEAAARSLRSGELEAVQASSQGDSLQRLAERINEVRERFAQIQSQFGAKHPEYRKTANRLSELERQYEQDRRQIIRRVEVEHEAALTRETMLRDSVAETKAEFDRLNGRSFEYHQVKREAESDKRLYEELVWRIKEAGLNANFHNSHIRLTDAARPPLDPVLPNVKLNLLLAFLLSSLVAVGAALVSDVTDTTLRDPEEVKRMFDVDVIGNLPVVKNRGPQLQPVPAKGGGKLVRFGGESASPVAAAYDEAIRTLRNSILLTDFDRNIRSLLVTSAQPGEGKSTTGVSLAAAHAQQGHRTLVIDGDMRRPTLHRALNIPNTMGLTNVLSGEVPWRDAVRQVEGAPNLEILSAGPPSRQPSDLISLGMTEVLGEAVMEYDLVLLDAPPLLGFAEPLQMATAVDGVLVVTQAGETSRTQVGAVLATLKRLRVNVLGIVLNKVHHDLSNRYYYGTKYYKYYESTTSSEAKVS